MTVTSEPQPGPRMPEDAVSNTFIIGAPRSGTSWFQSLVGAHPRVVTSQETDLFSRYLAVLWDAWEHELGRSPDLRVGGLITALTQEEFEEQLRSFALAVHARVLAMKPGATMVLEKTPASSLQVPLIDRLLPTARYIHVIRDGRDVAVSLVAGSQSWNRFFPGSIREAAVMWRDYVQGALKAAAFEERYIEVRYESLIEDAGRELLRAFDFLGLDGDLTMCEEIVDAHSFASLAAHRELSPSIAFGGEAARRFGRPPEPEGFFRRGRAGGWSTTLSSRQLRIFDEVAGELLASLGYEASRRAAESFWRARRIRPLRRVERFVRRGARSVGWRLHTWGAR